ncbi:MAG: 30S ribosomal protein S1 [Myxococcales bacterium]|nr:30S ribosomal protein S1 [Myxococcales bacterium]
MSSTALSASTEEESFEQLFESSLRPIREGRVVSGTVLRADPEFVLVDIGYKSEGRIATWEFAGHDGIAHIKVGDRVDVMVDSLEGQDGVVILSKERADRLRVWQDLGTAFEEGRVVSGSVTGRVKGGLSVNLNGLKAFLPGSQVDLRPVRNLDRAIGERYDFKIIKFNQRRGNIVLSRRALLETERQSMRDETLKSLAEGQIVDGIVKNLTEYGAFIDLGGIDGLLHITDMSWGRISHPSELFHVGDQIKVKVLKFEAASERVSLGIKQTQPDPWADVGSRYPIGLRIRGNVVSLADYGAFVELEPGIDGLIHISEMSWTRRVKHPSKVVAIGDEVDVLVLDVEEESRKISLGMKQIEPNPWSLLEEKYPCGTRLTGTVRNVTNFGVFVGVEEGIDGLVHISDISWTAKIKDPKEVYSKGDEVETIVLKIDQENEKFSLGIKQLEPSPWRRFEQDHPIGSKVQGKVTSIVDFGVFVELEPGIEGLVFNSDVSAGGRDEREQFKPGEEVEALVMRVDPVEQKIALSIRAVEDREAREAIERNAAQARTQTATLGDRMPRELLEQLRNQDSD